MAQPAFGCLTGMIGWSDSSMISAGVIVWFEGTILSVMLSGRESLRWFAPLFPGLSTYFRNRDQVP